VTTHDHIVVLRLRKPDWMLLSRS